jgi:hypothetical protein
VLIEIIGPRGVGKSTVGPRVADLLGLPFHVGLGATTVDGHPVRRPRVDMARSAVSHPRLLLAAWSCSRGPGRRRLAFAIALCRRARFASRVTGLLDGGPVHGICQQVSRDGVNCLPLTYLAPLPDLAVFLRSDPAIVLAQFEEREGQSPDPEEPRRYAAAVRSLPPQLAIIEVEAVGSPPEVAARVARRILSIRDFDVG